MTDEGMNEIRTIRRQISEEFGHNIGEYIAYLHTQDEQYATQSALAQTVLGEQKQEENTTRLQQAA